MIIELDTSSMASYRDFLKVKRLPTYHIGGRTAYVPDEYAGLFGGSATTRETEFSPSPFLFDYQRDIAAIAVKKRKYAVFAECGLGKTLILLDFARHCLAAGKRTLIVSPLMVIPQTIQEAVKFYGAQFVVEQVPAANLADWLATDGPAIGITNYEAMRPDVRRGKLGAMILDESSMLKSHYGKWGQKCIELGRGLEYKLALTGTPAPNDRIEYANHAVFLDAFRTVNEFLARYFVNRGQTQKRWEIKPHALKPFYRDLSHWCIFLSDPSVYGWKDNCDTIPPINVHIERVDLTPEQRAAVQGVTGGLFAKAAGGIGQRGKLGQIAKGNHDGKAIATNKPDFIRDLVASWPKESTLIWCRYNREQDEMDRVFPEAGSIRGETAHERRLEIVDAFKAGELRNLISKPKILGFGLNLQIATRQVFSGLQDSYEEFHQAVKRSNRIGSTQPLNVHIPVTEVEEPMVETVLAKAHRVEADTREQEALFKECGHALDV